MDFLNTIFLEPILNILLVLTNVLFGNFGLGVIALTIIVRLILFPLSWMQLRSGKKQSEAMAAMRPKLEQLKKKYAKNPQKLNQEQWKLMKEAGVSPMGCLSSPMLLSTVIQLPIYVALYRAVIQALAATPQDFLGLSQNLYSWSLANEGLPIGSQFLWLNLAAQDPYFVLPILVGVTQWISIKMTVQPTTDAQQQSMNSMMTIMMPLMMAFFTMTMPSGLGIYWLVSQVITIVIQYFIYGWGGLFAKAPAPEAAAKPDGKTAGGKVTTKGAEAGSAAKEAKEQDGGLGGLLNRFKRKQGKKDKRGKAD